MILVSQSLCHDTIKSAFCPFQIVTSELDAIAVAEIELRNIAMKMAPAAMLVDALHSGHSPRPWRMHVAANVSVGALAITVLLLKKLASLTSAE